MLKTFADQAVIAIENVRLFRQLEERNRELTESLEQQTATADVLKVISGSPGDLEPVFQTMLENATRICDAQFGMLWLSEGGGFRPVALHGVPPDLADQRRSDRIVHFNPELPFGRLVETKQLVHVADLTTEPGYLKGISAMARRGPSSPSASESAIGGKADSARTCQDRRE